MAKKKKKKGGTEESTSEYTLDSALKTSKNTESTLHGLLDGITEEFSFLSKKKQEEGKIEPRLSHESEKKIVEEYMLEQVPLSERGRVKDRKRIVTPQEPKKIQTQVIEESETKIKEVIPQKEEIVPKVSSTIKEPSFSKKEKENIYVKLTEFFEALFQGYNERYDRWENSTSSILSILRKMRKITKKNTEDLVATINNLHDKIQYNLEQFEVKRDEVKKITNVDVESMSSEFKKVLGLLELQIKEYQLKRLTDEYIHEQRSSL